MGLGSGIRKNRIPDPGQRVKKAQDPRSGSVKLLKASIWISVSAFVFLSKDSHIR
jgi:hypothetical protein